MIGADEATLCNAYGCVIIVRRGPNRDEQVRAYALRCEELGVDMTLSADEIRDIVWKSEQ